MNKPLYKLLLLTVLLINFTTLVGQVESRKKSLRKPKQQEQLLQPQQNPVVKSVPNSETKPVIIGTIIDQQTGETLIGAVVRVVGQNKGVESDFEGKFVLEGLEAGQTYALLIEYTEYRTKQISNLKLDKTQKLTIPMEPSQLVQLEGAVIEAEADKASSAGLLILQRTALQMMDGFSGEMVLKETPDFQLTTALRRLPGVALIEDRFLSVRGMFERFNTFTYNRAPMPFSDFERIGFDYTMLPANLISNLVLIKSATPDLISEFGGGLIQVSTADIPYENTSRVFMQMGYNDRVTAKPSLYYPGTSDFILGNHRNTLDDMPTPHQLSQLSMDSPERYEYAKKVFKGNVAEASTAPMNMNMGFAIQRRFKVKETSTWGFTAYANFLNNHRYQESRQNLFANYNDSLKRNPVNDAFFDQQYQRQQNATLMFNTGYQSKRGKIALKTLFIRNTESFYSPEVGKTVDDINPYHFFMMRFTQSSLLSNQLELDQSVNLFGKTSKLEATLFNSMLWVNEPGYRAINFITDTNGVYYFDASHSEYNSVYQSRNRFGQAGISTSLTTPLYKDKVQLKAGLFTNIRYRRFRSRQFGLNLDKDSAGQYRIGDITFNSSRIPLEVLLESNRANVWDNRHFGPGGFQLHDFSSGSHNYNAISINVSPFVCFDARINPKLRLFTGLRIENFTQTIDTIGFTTNSPLNMVSISNVYLLPSLTTIYSLSEKTNLRFSYCKTLNRPTERELTPMPFLDYVIGTKMIGNPKLTETSIHNLDFKFEKYLSGKEILAIGLFYKYFIKPMEQVFADGELLAFATAAQNYLLSNQRGAQALGFEVDMRFNLGERTGIKSLNDFTIYANFIASRSRVRLDSSMSGLAELFKAPQDINSPNYVPVRRLQGQADYVVNAGIIWFERVTKLNFGLFYNRTGYRIAFVGAGAKKFPSIWELPRDIIDFQVSRTFFEKLDIRLALTDVLNQPIQQVLIYDDRSTYDPAKDDLSRNIQRGFTGYLGLSYRF